MATILHITTRDKWKLSITSGQYSDESLQSEGFIHCSTVEQLVGTANRIFKGQADLVVLRIDTSDILSEIAYENLDGGSEKYPHIYGPINHDAVKEVIEFPPSGDGSFVLPGALQGKQQG